MFFLQCLSQNELKNKTEYEKRQEVNVGNVSVFRKDETSQLLT
jgi:hypothetical protein